MISLARNLAVELYRRDRVLTVFAAVAAAAAILTALPLAFDTRLVTGLNPWVKPTKFFASFALYFATFGWLLAYLPRPNRRVSLIRWVTGLCLLLEAPALIVQPLRGVTSHFNTASGLDTFLFYIMGVGAFTQLAMVAWALVLFCICKVQLPAAPLAGIRAGLALWLLGIIPGLVMLVLGAHNVGVADGGPGLPLLNWSTVGGDLRIAHFLGLHALQVLPLAGFAAQRLRKSPADRGGRIAFDLIVAGYAFAMLATCVQAMAGMPLIALN
ncbi:MAG: hypothetical protein RIC55_24790 [Pirellulaceae bacterium]